MRLISFADSLLLMYRNTNEFCILQFTKFFVRSPHVVKANLKLLDSSDSLASVSKVAGTEGMSNHVKQSFNVLVMVFYIEIHVI